MATGLYNFNENVERVVMSLVSRNISTAPRRRQSRPLVVVSRLTASRIAKMGLAFALGVAIAAAAAKMLYLLAA